MRGGRFIGWRMVAIGALAQNCAMGLAFASYGALIPGFQQDFATSRALASSGIGALVLTMSLCSPLVGGLLQRFPVRWVMIAGAGLSAAGYAALLLAGNMYEALAIYLLLIGPGTCFVGVIPAATLVSNWFVRDRGKALGIINMPILLLLLPPLFGLLASRGGIDGVFTALAIAYAALILPLLFVIGRPEAIGQRPLGEGAAAAGAASAPAAAGMSTRALLRMPAFWMVGIAAGLLNSGGTMIVTHFVPFGIDRGFSLESAALLVSAFGGAGVIGALGFGWLADRIGAMRTMAANATLQGLLWIGLLLPLGFPALLVLAALMGAGAGAVLALLGAALNELVGRGSFSRAMGFIYIVKLPLIVGSGPLAGFLYDRTGSYAPAIGIHILAFFVTAAVFARLSGRVMAPQ